MQPITKGELAKEVSDLVFRDLLDVTNDILKNREQLEKIDTKLSSWMRSKQQLIEIIGKFLQML
jgi:hypothetical protein